MISTAVSREKTFHNAAVVGNIEHYTILGGFERFLPHLVGLPGDAAIGGVDAHRADLDPRQTAGVVVDCNPLGSEEVSVAYSRQSGRDRSKWQ